MANQVSPVFSEFCVPDPAGDEAGGGAEKGLVEPVGGEGVG